MPLLRDVNSYVDTPFDPSGDGGGAGDPYGTPPPVTPPAVPPTVITSLNGGAPVPPLPTGGGGGGGGGGGNPGGFDYGFGPVPGFNAPEFTAPDAKSILDTPGYQARLSSGEQALQRSAAAKGLVRTGGTLKDLIEYGQNFASNEYNNAFGQALQSYGTRYQLAKDKYAPLLAQWDLLSKAEIQKQLAAYNRGTVWNAPHSGGGGGGDPFPDPNIFGL